MPARLLVVDDEPAFRETFGRILRDAGHECLTAPDAEAALGLLAKQGFDLVLADIHLPGMDGMKLLERITEIAPQTFTLMITAYGSFDTAVEAIRKGAFDYISKPVNFDDALLRIQRILERRDALLEIQLLRRDIQRQFDFSNIVGRSAGMKAVFALVEKVARTMSTVLVTGESGTGKELVARAIHYSGDSRNARFVALNCAALPDSLLESELFGHVKGAFTGASADKRGLFEVAEGGTLFFDEVCNMSVSLQAKLLRAIEEREIIRVGGTAPIRVNTRLVVATNRDLKQMVDEGTFRHDLYYRINVVEIRLPPLRERRDDIPALVGFFLEKYGRELRRGFRGVENDAMRALVAHEWRGNVRELENVIERAMIVADGETLTLRDLPLAVGEAAPRPETDELRAAMRACERGHIRSVLEKTGGNKEEAARRLAIGLSSLYRKIDELGLKAPPPPRATPRSAPLRPAHVPECDHP